MGDLTTTPQLRDTEVDGVRCLWVDTGRPTLAAALMFRQGMCDEPLVESGWLHMLEHLALHGRGGGALHVNGSVSLMHTSFDAHGPADAVAHHLAAVTRYLADPALEDFERERGVLRAEGNIRGGPVSRALAWRYGARGPGVASYAEPGIGRATPEALTDRAHRVFGRQNAVLVLDGPPPADLKLGLREGHFLAPSAAVQCEDDFPAGYVDESGVVLSGVVERSTGATVVPHLIERALRDRLRNQAGAAYAPWSVYEPVDGKYALAIAGSDINDEMHPEIVKTIQSVIRAIGEDGFPADHVREVIDGMAQSLSDPYNTFGLAYRAANAFFDGRPPQSLEAVLDEIHAITRESLARDWAAFSRSRLVSVPGKSAWDNEFRMLGAPTHYPKASGKRFRHQDWPATSYELRIDDDVVQIAENDEARSLKVNDLEAVMSFSDGGRHLVGPDGWNISIEPGEWADGAKAVSMIDQMIPAAKNLPHPARTGPTHAERLAATTRWWRAGRKVAASTSAIRTYLVIGVPALVVLIIIAGQPQLLFWGAIGAGIASWKGRRS